MARIIYMVRASLVISISIAVAGCVGQPPVAEPSPAPAPPPDAGTPADWQPPRPDAAPPPPDAALDPEEVAQRQREARWAELERRAAAEPDTVFGMATSTQVVRCGGAAPPPDEPYSVSSPWGGRLLVRKGNKNSRTKPVAVVRVGTGGVFSVDLPRGTYCLVEEQKKNPPSGTPGMYVDPACLRQQWETCDAVVEHPSGKPVALGFFTPCFGRCYHGPLPP